MNKNLISSLVFVVMIIIVLFVFGNPNAPRSLNMVIEINGRWRY